MRVTIFLDSVVVYGDLAKAGLSGFSCFLEFPDSQGQSERSSVIPLMNRMHFNIQKELTLQRSSESEIIRFYFYVMSPRCEERRIGVFEVILRHLNSFRISKLAFFDDSLSDSIQLEAPVRVFSSSVKHYEYFGFKEFESSLFNENNLEYLGSGSFGDVFIFRHENHKYAAKFIRGGITNSTLKDPFVRELLPFLELQQHPCILEMVGYFYEASIRRQIFGLVLEFMPHGSLESQYNKLSGGSKTKVVYGLSSALSFMNSHGFIHRDIKPSNILLDESDECRLSDFGLVKSLGGLESDLSSFIGTPGFMSPENSRGQRYDFSTDMFSVGVVVGSLFFCENTTRNDIKLRMSELPRSLRCFVSASLSKNPVERPTFDETMYLIEKGSLSFSDTDEEELRNCVFRIENQSPQASHVSMRNDFIFYLDKFEHNVGESSILLLHIGFMAYRRGDFSLSSEYFKLGYELGDGLCGIFFLLLLMNGDGVAFDTFSTIIQFIDETSIWYTQNIYDKCSCLFALLPFVDCMDLDFMKVCYEMLILLSPDRSLNRIILKREMSLDLLKFISFYSIFDFERSTMIYNFQKENEILKFTEYYYGRKDQDTSGNLMLIYIICTSNEPREDILCEAATFVQIIYTYKIFRKMIDNKIMLRNGFEYWINTPNYEKYNLAKNYYDNPDILYELSEHYKQNKGTKKRIFFLKWAAKLGNKKAIEYFQDPKNVELYREYIEKLGTIKVLEYEAFYNKNVKSIKKVINHYLDWGDIDMATEYLTYLFSLDHASGLEICYQYSMNRDKILAFKIIKEHYELTHSPQSAYYISMHYKENGDEINHQKYLEIALDGKNLDALSVMCSNFLLKEDYQSFYSSLIELAKQESIPAIRLLLILSIEMGDEESRQSLAQLGASKGDAECQYELARIFKKKNDINNMVYYLYTASLQDYPPAQYELGKLLIKGDVINQDINTGFFLIEKSAENGHKRAMMRLIKNYSRYLTSNDKPDKLQYLMSFYKNAQPTEESSAMLLYWKSAKYILQNWKRLDK